MAKYQIDTVEDYFALLPAKVVPLMEEVRAAILAALPEAEEVIAYDMPTYKVGVRTVIHFAAWKRHYSLYPVGKLVLETLKDELAGVEIDKSTMKFALDEPVPTELIGKIVKLRLREEAHKKGPIKRKR
jgi:uncharacterized protein YdhG (YjbR/CyaY superfamily)